MSLKAILDGKEIIGELMDYQAWANLKIEVKDGSVTLTTVCCHNECFPRESKLGTRHFVHRKGTDCGFGKGETFEHMLLKARILRGCRDAGYEVDTEEEGDGWRADVLAKNDKWKFAFEIQWSPQTYEETVERQLRYEKADIRCAWIFRKMPDQSASTIVHQPQKYIPMFQVEWDMYDRPEICGLDVETFAKELLLSHFCLCERVMLEPVQIIMLEIAETSCWKCKRNYHVIHFNKHDSPLVDIHGGKHDDWDDIFPDGVEYSPIVIDALNMYKRTAKGRKYAIGEIKPRYSHTEKKTYVSQGCPYCDALNGRFYLEMEWHELEFIGHLYLAIPLPENSSIEGTHWCHSENKHFCPKQ